jgi:hypothetical protein
MSYTPLRPTSPCSRPVAQSRHSAAALYRTDLDAEALGTIRTATNRREALSNDRFREMIESALGRRSEPKCGARPRRGPAGIDGEQIEFEV